MNPEKRGVWNPSMPISFTADTGGIPVIDICPVNRIIYATTATAAHGIPLEPRAHSDSVVPQSQERHRLHGERDRMQQVQADPPSPDCYGQEFSPSDIEFLESEARARAIQLSTYDAVQKLVQNKTLQQMGPGRPELQGQPGVLAQTSVLDDGDRAKGNIGTTTESKLKGGQPDEAKPAYFIPAKTFQEAVAEGKYWSHTLYQNAQGEPVTVHYSGTTEASEKLMELFLDEEVVGFDLEWDRWATQKSPGRYVSLMQVASEKHIGLVHIALHKGGRDKMITPAMRRLIESDGIVKTGVNIRNDFNRINRIWGVAGRGIMELGHLHNLVTCTSLEPTCVSKKMTRMDVLTKIHLGLPLDKGPVRESRWWKPLSPLQRHYAASDAYVGLQIFLELERKRKKMNPQPYRPPFAELGRPVLFPGRKPLEETENNTSNSDVKNTGEPCQNGPESALDTAVRHVSDDHEFSGSEYGDVFEDEEFMQELEGTGLLRSNESSFCKDNILENSDVSPAKPGGSTDYTTTKQRSERAAAWVADWRRNLPSNSRRLMVKERALEAYALWYDQQLGVGDIGSMMRTPPLKDSSVAMYVVDCLMMERLPYRSVAEIRTLLDMIPERYRASYGRFEQLLCDADARNS